MGSDGRQMLTVHSKKIFFFKSHAFGFSFLKALYFRVLQYSM